MSEPIIPPQVTSQVSETLGRTGLDPDTVSVAALRQALADGALTAAELTAFYLSRIERLNPALHAVISLSPQAAADARANKRQLNQPVEQPRPDGQKDDNRK